MQVYGLDSIRVELDSGGYVVKLIAHEHAAAFFSRAAEHREIKVQGLNYEDDSKGNALAAMMSPGRIDFRYHRAFSDERVKRIALAMLNHPDLRFAQEFQVTYQGRVLLTGQFARPTCDGR
jgi:hypothetical protein